MCRNTSGYYNVGVGAQAVERNTTGHDNTGVGFGTLILNSIGFGNTGVGSGALSTATGNDNTSVGSLSLTSLTTGCCNVAIGVSSLENHTSGCNNVAIGNYAGTGIGEITCSNKLYIANCNQCSLICGSFTGKTVTINNKLFSTNITTSGLQVTGGTLATGYVLTSDANGNATWQADSGGALIKNVYNSTTTTYSMASTDFYIGTSGGTTISLLPNINGAAVNGQIVVVADVYGNAAAGCEVTINSSVNFFGGAGSAYINTAFGSMTFIYNGGKSCWGLMGFSTVPI